MMENSWTTSITNIGPGKIEVRGYPIEQLMEKKTFAETIFLVLKGELPNPAEAEMFEAILVSSVDHGVSPPSVLGARNSISAGNQLNAAVAAGVLSIGDVHGGAIERSAKIMQEWAGKEGSPAELAAQLVEDLSARKVRMPGFGHRLHTTDPRTIKLFEKADRLDFSGRHIDLCKEIENALEAKTGKRLPINVDGAIAAVVSDMGFDYRLGKGFFIMSRTAGLIAHAFEEWTTQRPMRKLGDTNSEYTGPQRRDV
ncbi:MAG: citryl-CoA lyase [candidate division Zixibacteria bacterium]|nr:citryl-CoA lyase [candidate division Zixibacteria bacterium]MBU1471242.1 citryl-CoA lyase [candidate division Zixibacteria bacterium]MBU2624944.1 citryl-CoA lyase [candidate division Zixibacteria bacterium]